MPQKSRRPIQFDERMSDADMLMWNLETDPGLRSTILSTWILDRAPDRERFEATVKRATHVIPRLRQRVVADPLGIAPPRWEADPHFDLRFHLRRARVPAPGSVRDLLDLAEPLAMQAFDKDRPLWELHLVEGLEGDRCAVIMKLHHAISDGVGLVKMTECLIERGPDDTRVLDAPPETVPAPASEPSAWDRIGDALAHRVRQRAGRLGSLGAYLRDHATGAVRSPLDTLRQVRDTLSSVGRVLAPASEPLSPVMRGRSNGVHFDYLPLSLAELKRAGKAVGGTVNDAFVAGVAGGLARYHAALGQSVESLRMLMPVNVRNGEKADRAGNQFAPARFAVPVGIRNPAERMRAIGRLCREQRDEPALPWIEEITSALGSLPPAAVLGLFGAMQKATDFTTSNVPGPRRPTWMSGARVEAFMPFGPLAGAGANLTVFSYNGTMHVGINTDPAAVEDPALLLECMRKAFDEVLAVV
ncbi:MAG: wax ester/triacylglycerol synthase family O-acyltransferase [Myxococcota bacterium]|nr:wax ester/triacylglycerol synthase family O-acyltransferase [Myxococcota bacterium]